MIKAKNPDQTRITYSGSVYSIDDAYSTKVGTEGRAKDLRTLQGRVYPNTYTKAVVVDMGKDAGRLRYAVFIAKGRKI
jgi:hypothetical protein